MHAPCSDYNPLPHTNIQQSPTSSRSSLEHNIPHCLSRKSPSAGHLKTPVNSHSAVAEHRGAHTSGELMTEQQPSLHPAGPPAKQSSSNSPVLLHSPYTCSPSLCLSSSLSPSQSVCLTRPPTPPSSLPMPSHYSIPAKHSGTEMLQQ